MTTQEWRSGPATATLLLLPVINWRGRWGWLRRQFWLRGVVVAQLLGRQKALGFVLC